jgi:hypothetical protein
LDPEIFTGSGAGVRTPKDAYYQSEKLIFSHLDFQYLIFTANPEKNFRTLVTATSNSGILKSGGFNRLSRIRQKFLLVGNTGTDRDS